MNIYLVKDAYTLKRKLTIKFIVNINIKQQTITMIEPIYFKVLLSLLFVNKIQK